MALLVEGLDVGGETSIEEYIIAPDGDLADTHEHVVEKDHIKLYGAEEGQSWIAKPVRGQSTLGMVSRHGSMVDPMVTLFGSVHEKLPENGSMRSMLFSNFGSMFNIGDQQKHEEWDEENPNKDGNGDASDGSGDESDNENLRSPLLSRQGTHNENEQVSGVGIGGGWQLAYRKDENNAGGLKRIYLHQEGGPGSRRGSVASISVGDVMGEGEQFIHASALVSQSVLRPGDITDENPIGSAINKKPEPKTGSWRDLFVGGVMKALVVGVGLQILQQVI